MKNNVLTTLEKVRYNSECYFVGFSPTNKLNIDKLYDFGFTKNSKITPLFSSIFTGAKAYLIKGSVIAIRNQDAKDIIVRTRG